MGVSVSQPTKVELVEALGLEIETCRRLQSHYESSAKRSEARGLDTFAESDKEAARVWGNVAGRLERILAGKSPNKWEVSE